MLRGRSGISFETREDRDMKHCALAIALTLLAGRASADTIVVQQIGNSFQPANVTICVGDTVQWVWNSGLHTVTEGTDGTVDGNEAFHQDLDAANSSYSVTFDPAFVAANGNFYDYFCFFHFAFGMDGTITVGDCPQAYCTAKTSSAGCVTAIGTSDRSNQPVSGASSYFVTATDVHTFKNGLVFAGISGPSSIPFGGGLLCVSPPNKRGPIMNSGGSGANLCDGSLMTEVNDGAIIPAGLDPGPGNTGWYQYWYRDPANGAGNLGTALSNAIELDFQ